MSLCGVQDSTETVKEILQCLRNSGHLVTVRRRSESIRTEHVSCLDGQTSTRKTKAGDEG